MLPGVVEILRKIISDDTAYFNKEENLHEQNSLDLIDSEDLEKKLPAFVAWH
jgi:hypothetical protein